MQDLLVKFLQSVVSILPLAGSLYLWVIYFQKRKENQLIIPERFSESRVQVPTLALFMGVNYLVLMTFLEIMSFQARGESAPVFNPDLIIKAISGQLVFNSALIIAFLAAIWLSSTKDQLEKLGFRTDHLLAQIQWGVLGAVAGLLPVILVALLTSLWRNTETLHPVLRLIEHFGVGPELIPIFLLTVVAAPVLEELVFRVILQNWLVSRFSPKVAIGLTAFIFAAVHQFPDSVALIPLAIILGVIYYKQRSFLTVVLLHALFNAYNVVNAILQPASGS